MWVKACLGCQHLSSNISIFLFLIYVHKLMVQLRMTRICILYCIHKCAPKYEGGGKKEVTGLTSMFLIPLGQLSGFVNNNIIYRHIYTEIYWHQWSSSHVFDWLTPLELTDFLVNIIIYPKVFFYDGKYIYDEYTY